MAKIKNKKTGKVYEVTQKQSVDILTSRFGRAFIEIESEKKKEPVLEDKTEVKSEKPKPKRKKDEKQ